MGKISNAAHAVERYNQRTFNSDTVGLMDDELLEWLGIDKARTKNVNAATYYTCLRILSETMGKLPLKYLQDVNGGRIRADLTQIAYLLTTRPNEFVTPSTFWTSVEMNTQHFGNGYVWMRGTFNRQTYGGTYDVYDLWVLPSNNVSVIMDDKGVFGGRGKLYYQYGDPASGEVYLFRRDEILHFKTWYSFDGIMGQPVSKILKAMVEGEIESQTFLNNLYKSGLTAAMAMQYTGDLDDDRIKKLQKKFADKLTGSQNAGKVIPVPASLQLVPLKMSLTDSQFFELKKYTALQIAAAFGVKPDQLNNYEESSYASSEMQMLAFLVETMQSRIKAYEEEINSMCLTRKEISDGYLYKFNEKALLRTDSATQMDLITKAVNNGVYTPNEGRGFLDLPAKEGGDQLIVNGNYIPLTRVGDQYAGGGD